MEDEKEVIQEEKPEVKSTSLIESAHSAAEELRKQNEIMKSQIAKLQELRAFETLGGKSDAGEQPPVQKEETPQEYTKRIQQEIRDRKFNERKI